MVFPYANILVNLDGGSYEEDWIESVTKFVRNASAHGREVDTVTLRVLTILVERAHSEMRDKESAQTKSAERSDMLEEGGASHGTLSPEATAFVPSGQAGAK